MKIMVLTIVVFGAFASCLFAQQPEGEAATEYGGCWSTNPQDYCDLFHPGSVATGGCIYEQCFKMNYSSACDFRIVALDEGDAFPKTWFVWSKGTMTTLSQWIGFPCILTERGHKTLLEIPETEAEICAVDLITSGYVHHEHLASSQSSGCLGWVECTETAPVP